MTDLEEFDAFDGVIAALEPIKAGFELAFRLCPSEANGAAVDGLDSLIADLRERQAQYDEADAERSTAERRAERRDYEGKVL